MRQVEYTENQETDLYADLKCVDFTTKNFFGSPAIQKVF